MNFRTIKAAWRFLAAVRGARVAQREADRLGLLCEDAPCQRCAALRFTENTETLERERYLNAEGLGRS